jgi:ABC-2 type transport system permease protein
MSRTLGKYWAIFKTQLVHSLSYPADLFSRSLTIALFLWIFAHLWAAAYESAGQERIAGLSRRDTLWYLMIAEVIVLSRPRLSGAIAEGVKDGSIAYLLNRPCNFLFYQAGVGLGDSALRLLCNLLAGGALTWLMVGPPPGLGHWSLVLPAIAGAWAIDCCIGAMIGLLSFVAEEVSAFEWIYSKLSFILGGLLVPLDFFPGWLRVLSGYLPFACIIYGPARAFVDPDPGRFLALFAGQVCWLALLGGLLLLGYRRSVVHLNINGG